MRNKIQAPDKQVLHKQVPKAQALQKEKDPRLVAVGGFGQDTAPLTIVSHFYVFFNMHERGKAPLLYSSINPPLWRPQSFAYLPFCLSRSACVPSSTM